MKIKTIHSVAVLLAAFAFHFIVACSSQDDYLPGENSENASLYLKIATIEQASTRAKTGALSVNEKMHSVRVVVLHADGTVEHNRNYSLDGAQEQTYIRVPVTESETKSIFVFANEESVSEVFGADTEGEDKSLTAFFNGYAPGMPGFEDAVRELYFVPDYSDGKNIPMSSESKTVSVPESGVVNETFHVVRVATKFTINFTNWRGEKVTVDDFTLESYADMNFLMARVNDSDQNRELFKGKNWIDWLKDVSDASSENDDYDKTSAAGWLKDYELPSQADKTVTYRHGPVVVKAAEMDKDNPENLNPGVAETVPVFYLPESMKLKQNATDREQEYILTIYIHGGPAPFVRKLPNLKALFRNTHVAVNVTMNQNLDLTVDVIPFSDVPLTPDFGLKRNDYTGYIEGLDKDGHKCWYDGKTGPYYLGPNDAHEDFVTIRTTENGMDKVNDYLLVYSDYNRNAPSLHHIYERVSHKKYLIDPVAITGYRELYNQWGGVEIYLNRLSERVWLDFGGDPSEPEVLPSGDLSIYYAFKKIGLTLRCCHILYEWDRLDWNKARYWGWTGVYPKYWFDILGNRHPWSEGATEADRHKILGDWVQYLHCD